MVSGSRSPSRTSPSSMEEVEANGGVDAPTVPAPEGASGMDQLVPGLDDLLPGLDELFPEGGQGLEQLPGLEEMLDEMFGASEIPPELRQLLEELLGIPVPAQGEGGEGA